MVLAVEWNSVLEDRLRRAKRARGWRWIGYFVVFIALATYPVGVWVFDHYEQSDGSEAGLFAVLAGMFLVLGLVISLPAEKAAKQARELELQKVEARGDYR